MSAQTLRSELVVLDVVGIIPKVEITGDELASVIHRHRLRIAGGPADAFEGLEDRGGSVCLNSFGRFVQWITASIMPRSSLVPSR